VTQWLAATGAADVFRGGQVLPGSLDWDADRSWSETSADYVLVISPQPQADSPTTAPGNLSILLRHDDQTIRKAFPFVGHPEILRPRAAKQALNLLRLHLLGK
jgi:nicotinamide-nucleotide amidase